MIGEGEVKGTEGEVLGTVEDEEIVDKNLNLVDKKVRREIARIKADIVYIIFILHINLFDFFLRMALHHKSHEEMPKLVH